jgi:hypothetical protein
MGGIFGGDSKEPHMAGHGTYDPALFSDKVFDRLTAMSAVSDCCLVSSDGSEYPVHKATLLQQSKALRQAEKQEMRAAAMPNEQVCQGSCCKAAHR